MGVTVEGVPINAVQIKQAEILLGVVDQLKAGALCAEAIICAAIGESTLTNLSTPNSLGFWGVLQGYSGLGSQAETANFPPPSGWNDSAGMATAFLQGGKGFKSAMDQVRQGVTDPGQIATTCEGSGAPASFYGQHLADAKAIIAAYGGSAIKGGVAGAGGSGTTVNGSKASTYAFQIGGTSNPSEDFWTGTNRLAQEVGWYYFSNGEMLYYLDGQEMIAQKPALLLDRILDGDRIPRLRGTFDNTSYEYVSDHRRKFHVQRKTKLTTTTSPTEITLDLICGIDEVRGGDVIELGNFGPLDGRWIVGDRTRSVFSVTSSLTLVPPIAPLSEAAVAGTTGRKQSVGGTAGKPTGNSGNLASPFTKKYVATLANVDMGVDFGRQQGIATGDPILAIGDSYLRLITTFYQGQPAMWFELTDKSAGYWGWYVSEEINPKFGAGPNLIKGKTVVATYAASGTGIEIGWAAKPGVTATQAFHPEELANRHSGNGTTDGRAFLAFLGQVGAI